MTARHAPSSQQDVRSPPEPCKLLDLPEAVLARILALLPQRDRFFHVSLVCRRLKDVCLAPELLHSLELRSFGPSPYEPNPPSPVLRLQGLARLLAGHGNHVRSLSILVHNWSVEVATLVTSCLEACLSVGSSLQQLSISHGTPFADASAVTALTRLTALTLGDSRQPLQLPAAFSQLTALQVADLAGRPLMLEGPCLPPSLTRLSIHDPASMAMPPQLSRLQGLLQLEVLATAYQPASMWPLASLTRLSQLSLWTSHAAPAGLSALTQLQRLQLSVAELPWAEEPVVQLDSVLAQLSGLTCLSLMNLLFVPPSIGEMPRLERLHLQQDYSEGMVVIELPRGPWLRSVRWLGLPWECLDDPDNLEVLRSTAQLEFLCALTLPCIGDREDSFDHWDAFFEWVATHPPLRCFGFEPGDVAEVKTELLNAVLNMVQRRPRLILRHVDYDSPGFLREMLDSDDIPTKPTPFGGW